VSQSSNELSLKFGSQELTLLSAAPTITLNEWKLIGFTASLKTNQGSTSGAIFRGTSSAPFSFESSMDFSTASVIRIGDASNSFSGQVSTVRIINPGGGIVRTSKL